MRHGPEYGELADEADRWLGKPVLAIHAVIWRMALRENDSQDKLYGYGRMLRAFKTPEGKMLSTTL